ncbi:SRPBCC domain-containing protein [Halobacillus sp. A5]|uniref:SRPBCC family protein n=1 Tax=Halobacillus sp. A5 TaxID=2880263 RepID=UPI0020A6D99D|nr:SRPBCC domain-containing protein [Halobacillus sp. A5]MCP3026474.1 SRPBCC domain-containing protein [Halobacillus sp. A5]
MAQNRIVSKVDGRVLEVERVFEAPRDLVFNMFSESKHVESWWGPKGWSTTNKKFEFKPGGTWHYCMRCVDEQQGDFYGYESWGMGVFQNISTPETIVYTDSFADEEGNIAESMPESLVTLQFIDMGKETKLITRSQFETLENLETVMEMGVLEGVSSQFECLDDYLNQIQNL